MGEQSGKIVFINSHDYISDITGETWIGCLASLRRTDDSEMFLYTESLRLHHTLEMAYATGRAVTVSYWDDTPKNISEREPVKQVMATRESSDGMLVVKAIWTNE